MSTNRELLDLAAKAAGITIRWEKERGVIRARQQSGGYFGIWNPLRDDGDALRLAVLLGLTVNLYDRAVFISRNENEPTQMKMLGDDRYAATRRAIVRAAAAIGKEMP